MPRPRAIRWLIAALLAVILLGACAYCGKMFIWWDTVRPLPPSAALLTPTTQPSSVSAFSLPIEITTADLRAVVNAKAPPAFEAQFPIHVHGFDHEHVNVNLHRNDIDVSVDGDRLNFSMPVSGTAQFEGQFKPVPIGGGKHVTKTFDIVARISGSATVRLRSDWTLDVRPAVSIDVTRAHTDVVGIGVDVRARVKEAFDEKAPALADALVAQALASLDVRRKVQEFWKRLHGNLRLNDEPPAWVAVRPVELRVKPPDLSDPKVIRLGASLRARTQSYVETTVPPVEVAPLPEAVSDTADDDRFTVVVPVKASVNLLTSALNRQVGGRTVSAAGVRMQVSGISVAGRGDQVVVGFDFVAHDLFHWGSAKGRVYAVAKLTFDDPVTQVGLTGLTYDIESNNALLKVGDWIFKPKILAEIEKAAQVDIRGELEKARLKANDLIYHAGRPEHVAMDLKVEKLAALGLMLQGDDLYFLLTAEGRSSAQIKP